MIIDKNIPIPPARGEEGPRNEYFILFPKLDVGDSFLYPIKTTYKNAVTNLSRAKGKYAPDIKFRYKQEGDFVRVWRRK